MRRRKSRIRSSIRLLAILLLLPALISACRAQNAASPDHNWHFRYELFQMLLEQNGLEPVTDPARVFRDPESSVIVLLGNVNVFQPHDLNDFCERGGAVLVATDRSYSAGRIGEFMSSNSPVRSRRVSDWYQNHYDCLILDNIDSRNPLMKNVNSLVVNRTGWLAKPRWARREWDVAARLPDSTEPRRAESQPVIASLRFRQKEKGRLIMAADPSLFTNGMLWHGDNAILAINTSQLLCAGKRNRLLFLVDRKALESYRDSPMMNQTPPPPLPENLPENLPEPELATWLRIGNSVIRNVEETNVMNEAVADYTSRINSRMLRRAIIFAVAVIATLFILWSITSNNAPTHRPMPARKMKSAHSLNAGRKTEASEFGLAASMLARELCKELTGSSEPAEWQRQLSENPVSGNGPLQAKSAQKDIRKVLDLAVNTRTVHISRRKFEATGRMIQKLRQLHREGQFFSA